MSIGTQGPRQFQGLFSVIPFKIDINLAAVLDGDQVGINTPIPGAKLGDMVLVAPLGSIQDLTLTAVMLSNDNMRIQMSNNTGSTIDLGLITFVGVILKPNDNVFAAL